METLLIEELGYNYLFHYNNHTGYYACISRDSLSDYFNGNPNSKFGTSNPNVRITLSTVDFEDAAGQMIKLLEEDAKLNT